MYVTSFSVVLNYAEIIYLWFYLYLVVLSFLSSIIISLLPHVRDQWLSKQKFHQKRLKHWPKIKLDQAFSGVWLGRHDQTALTSGRGKKQCWSGRVSRFDPIDTDIYCDVSIIILCEQRICITSVLVYAIKYINVVLCNSVDLV